MSTDCSTRSPETTMAPTAANNDSDESLVRDTLLTASRQGDWSGLIAALDTLARVPSSHSSAALHDRARMLEEALASAKSIRADMAASLVRLTAASGFSSHRQNSGEPTEF